MAKMTKWEKIRMRYYAADIAFLALITLAVVLIVISDGSAFGGSVLLFGGFCISVYAEALYRKIFRDRIKK